MVDLNDIEVGEDRIDLKKLLDHLDQDKHIELRATSEKIVKASVVEVETEDGRKYKKQKSAGLQIDYINREAKVLTQKYTKISGKALKDSCVKMGLKTTEDLQKAFYIYELKIFDKGNPRLIPIAISKTMSKK